MAGKQAVYDVFTRFRIDAKGWDKSLNRLSRSLARTGKQMQRAGENLTKNLTLPLALAGGAAVKFAVDLEQSFSKIQNLVGISTETLKGFTQEVRRISDQTGKAQKGLADALFTVTSAGEKGAEAIQILEQAAKASAAGLGETQSIARTVTAVLQAYGKENITAARATDILFSAVREGNLEAESLSGALGPVLGLAAKLGVSFAEVSANVATFTRLGVSAEQAATSLQAIFSTFLKPADGAKKAMSELGLSAQGLRDSIAKNGLADTLIDLVGRVGDNDEALAEIIPNIRALRGVLGTAGVQTQSYADILKSIATNTDLVNQGFKNVSKTAGQKFKVALTNLQNVAIELGNVLIPIVVKVVEKATQLINVFKGFSDETKKTIVQVALIVAAIGPALFIFGKLFIVLSTIVKVFKALNIAMLITAAKVLAVVAAVAGLVAVGVALSRNWENVQKFFVNVWDRIKLAFFKSIDQIKVLWASFLAFLGLDASDTFASIVSAQEQIEELQKKVNNQLPLSIQAMGVFNSTWEELKGVIDDVKGAATGAFKALRGGGTSTPIVEGGGETRKNALTGLPEIERLGSGITGNELIDSLGDTLEKIKVFGTEAKQVFVSLSETVQGAMVDLAVSIGEGLGNLVTSGGGFKQFFNTLLLTVTDFAAQFGKVLVSLGVAALALRTVAINPIAAIAAGTALIALSSIAKNLLSKGPDTPKLAVGTNMVTESGLAYLHRGEQVPTAAKVRNGGFSGGGSDKLVLESRIRAGDLWLIIKEEERKRGNTT